MGHTILLLIALVSEPAVRVYFTPRLSSEQKQGFADFEEQEKRSYERQFDGDGPLKYPGYRTQPPVVDLTLDETEIEDAKAKLKISDPTPEERKLLPWALALSEILPAQMRANDKFSKVRATRAQFALAQFNERVDAAGTPSELAFESRNLFAFTQFYRKARMHFQITDEDKRLLTTNELCRFVTESSPLVIEWTDYPFLPRQSPTRVATSEFPCDPALESGLILDQFSNFLRSQLKKLIGDIPAEIFEPQYFYIRRYKSFSIDFDTKNWSRELFWFYHAKELEGWPQLSVTPHTPPVNESQLMESIFDTLNLRYLEDQFEKSIERILAVESFAKATAARTVEWSEIKDYYANVVEKLPTERRVFQIEMQSIALRLPPLETEAIQLIYEKEYANVFKDISRSVEDLIARQPSSPDALDKENFRMNVISLRQSAILKLAGALRSRFGLSEEALTQDKLLGYKESWEQLYPKIENTAWRESLTKEFEKVKYGKRSLFTADTSLSENEDGSLNLRIGFILCFEMLGLYELQLDLADELQKRDLRSHLYEGLREILLKSARILAGPESPWHSAKNLESEALTADDYIKIMEMSRVLAHLNIKKTPYLSDDFLVRKQKENSGYLFGLIP